MQGDKPGGQARFSGCIHPCGHGHVTDQTGASEECLHLGGFHTVASNLHLEVAPAQMQQTAIGQHPAQVAGSEQTLVAALRVR